MGNDKGGIKNEDELVVGQVVQQARVPGCGEARAKNVLFIFRAGDGLETILRQIAEKRCEAEMALMQKSWVNQKI